MRLDRVMALSIVTASTLLATFTVSIAQDYPNKPITLVVPFAAGGPTDVASRLVGDAMSRHLGQPVVIENRAGASSAIGATNVAQAQNDGYRLLIGTTSTYATNPHTFKNLSYDPTKLEPIALVVKVPLAFAIRKDMPVTSLKELVEFAKKQANPLQYGSAGTGTHSSLACFLAAKEMGIRMQEIPYRGTGPALTDLMGGRVDALCDSVGTLSEAYAAGHIKIVGEFDDARSPAMKDVPTFKEAGYPNLVINNWFAATAPEGTSQEIVAKIAASIKASLADKALGSRLEQVGFVPQFLPPNELRKFMNDEYQRWKIAVKDAGITPQ